MLEPTQHDAAPAAQAKALPYGFTEVPPTPTNEWKPLNNERYFHKQPPAPPFPLEVFPPTLASVIRDAAACKNAAIGYVASSLLSVAGGLIGNSRSISPNHGWYEPLALWMMIVGTPSSNKSPAIDVCNDVI